MGKIGERLGVEGGGGEKRKVLKVGKGVEGLGTRKGWERARGGEKWKGVGVGKREKGGEKGWSCGKENGLRLRMGKRGKC